jgi:hypothetical protein
MVREMLHWGEEPNFSTYLKRLISDAMKTRQTIRCYSSQGSTRDAQSHLWQRDDAYWAPCSWLSMVLDEAGVWRSWGKNSISRFGESAPSLLVVLRAFPLS